MDCSGTLHRSADQHSPLLNFNPARLLKFSRVLHAPDGGLLPRGSAKTP